VSDRRTHALTRNFCKASHAQALEWLSGAITAISTSFFTIMQKGIYYYLYLYLIIFILLFF
jgi:hypothetical protein